MGSSAPLPEPDNVLYRIKRGLAGYASYLAACEMNESFSEYVLYEPMLRIPHSARHYSVECEVECPGITQPKRGDKIRLDFVAERENVRFAIEVKWARSKKLNVKKDHDKLKGFVVSCADGTDRGFLCVFGRESAIGALAITPDEFSASWCALVLFGDEYGCRIFELRPAIRARKAVKRARKATKRARAL